MAGRHLLVTPCDPGDCHIYFGVQLRALPTALALAKISDRTLVLPPFEYYEDQAQQFANAFRATASGQRPLYVPFSKLFDLDRLRTGGMDAVDFDSVPSVSIDAAVVQTGGPSPAVRKSGASDTPHTLDAALIAEPCRASRHGLRKNLSFAPDDTTRPTAVRLYGRTLSIGEVACGAITNLNPDASLNALLAWWADVPMAALFNVGHHFHTRVASGMHGREAESLAKHLRPNAMLDREAERFVGEAIHLSTTAAGSAVGARFIAAHWRHGDYVAYDTLTPPASFATRVSKAFEDAGCAPASRCALFLMTNCRDPAALDKLKEALPAPPIMYTPSADAYTDEGQRLVIEAAVASRAHAFVGSPRSAVTDLVEILQRGRRHDQRWNGYGRDKTEL